MAHFGRLILLLKATSPSVNSQILLSYLKEQHAKRASEKRLRIRFEMYRSCEVWLTHMITRVRLFSLLLIQSRCSFRAGCLRANPMKDSTLSASSQPFRISMFYRYIPTRNGRNI